MTIVIVKSVNGKYGYCPEAALGILGKVLEYSDEGFETLDDALEAVRSDGSIPEEAMIVVRSKSNL